MNDEKELLEYVRQDAEMGRDAVTHVMKFTEDPGLRGVLKHQLDGYQISHRNAGDLLKEYGGEAKGVNPMAKAMTYASTSMKTMTDRSASHIADLMIQGSTMGITTMTKHLNDYQGASDKVRALAEKQVKMEQDNIETLKKFL